VQDILFPFNAQHDCYHGQCPIVEGDCTEQQERHTTSRRLKSVQHTDDSRYLLNMHALHNGQRIRDCLPRHLTAPKPFRADRRAHHDAIAAQLRISGPARWAEIARKQKETRERNKKAADGKDKSSKVGAGACGGEPSVAEVQTVSSL